MSELIKECSAEYCNFQPVFEDKEKIKFKYYQCADCGYILTHDDIQRQLHMCGLYGDFRKFIDRTIAFYKDGNNNEYNDGFIVGAITTARNLGILANEQADNLIEKAGIDVSLLQCEEDNN